MRGWLISTRWIVAASFPVLAAAAGPVSTHADESADALVQTMIDAHGGADAWNRAPTVSFTDAFFSGGAPEGPPSRVVVEQASRRAYLDVLGTDTRLAWDGATCWSMNWESPMPPRFLALLNYYFLNLPWLTQDPGVRLERLDPRKLWDEETEYSTVRMTFEAGVGDTPDDYYILYIHPATHRLAACEYIVTYADLLPEGVKASPPHVLVYRGHTTVDGLLVPTKYTIFELDHREIVACEVRDWSFSAPFDERRLAMPPDAVVDTSRPTRQESGK